MRGASASQLVSDLREELRRANTPAASPEDKPALLRTLNHVIFVLAYSNDWQFLQMRFPAINLVAGQRYYDFPVGLDPDRVITAKVKWSGQYDPVEKGINEEDYNSYDPDDNQRSSPILKWDVRFTGVKEQIEVWPLPDGTTQTLNFFGIRAISKLVNDIDICPLESELVVLYAAAELAPAGSPDKDAKLALAKEALRLTKVRGNSAGGKEYQLGLSSPKRNPGFPVTVRVSG